MIMVAQIAFSITVQRWQEFYSVGADITATFLGLLFVAMSIHLDIIADEEHAFLRSKAVGTLHYFLFNLIFSLLFLLPHEAPGELGGSLVALGCWGLVSQVHRLRTIWSHPGRPRSNRYYFNRVVVPLASTMLVIAVGMTVVRGSTSWMIVLVPVYVWRLVTVVQNSWDLLLSVGYNKRGEDVTIDDNIIVPETPTSKLSINSVS
jgi:hypothetical protein